MPSIRIDKVTFSYGSSPPIFRDLSLAIDTASQGGIIAVVGASGVGKTTFLRLVAGLERPSSGTIRIAPEPSRLSFQFQTPVIFEHLSAYRNARYFRESSSHVEQIDDAEFERFARLLVLGPVLRGTHLVASLSGGERQRLALLRALTLRPHILMLDEPCSGLDAALRAEFIDILRRIADEERITVLYGTHHIDEVALISDHVLYFERPPAASSAVSARMLDTDDFLGEPPTLHAARLVLRPRCNVVYGNFVEEVVFEVVDAPGQEDRWTTALAFAPDAVIPITTGGPLSPPTVWARSRKYLWLAWDRPDGARVVAARPEAFIEPTVQSGLGIQGRVLCYNAQERFQRTIDGRTIELVRRNRHGG